MLDLIIHSWYKQQKTIDDIKIFKLVLLILFMITLFITNFIFYIILKSDNKFDSFVVANIFSLLLTQYNLPTIQEGLKVEKIKSFFLLGNFYKYIFFSIISKNFLLITFILVALVNIPAFLFTDQLNILLIIYLLFFQSNLFLFRFSNKKTKINLCLLNILYLLFIYINNSLVNIIICILNVIIYKFMLKNIFLYNFLSKNYKNIHEDSSTDNFFFYIITFLKRIKTGEYIEIIVTSLVGIVLYKFSGIKYLSYLLVIFFITKLQLIIENKQIQYKETYLKNAFYNSLYISTNRKILYSTELKTLIIEFLTLTIISIYLLFDKGPCLYIFIWMLNISLLMYLNLSKVLKTFYYFLDNKHFFKGTILNIVLIYLILIHLNFDIIFKYLHITNISDLTIEFIKLFFILICIIIKFEKLFMLKNYGGKDETQF